MFSFASLLDALYFYLSASLKSPNPQSSLLQYKHIIKIYMYSCDARILLSSRDVVKITLASPFFPHFPFLIYKQIDFIFCHLPFLMPKLSVTSSASSLSDTPKRHINSITYIHALTRRQNRKATSLLSPIDTCFVASEITKIVAPFVMSLCRGRRDREKA